VNSDQLPLSYSHAIRLCTLRAGDTNSLRWTFNIQFNKSSGQFGGIKRVRGGRPKYGFSGLNFDSR